MAASSLPNAPELSPVSIYHAVSKTIQEQYYDPTYNGQNWNRWEHRYDGQITDVSTARRAIETMLASLGDRYTRYLDESAFHDEKSQIAFQYFGVGIFIGMGKTGRISITAPIYGSPAAKAGLMPEDQIIAIDGRRIPTGMPLEQACTYIRGPAGTHVSLTIARGTSHKVYRLKRADIPVHGVSDTLMLNDEIGYIRINTFMGQEGDKYIRDALSKLNNARGIVIDLRDNAGGLMANAIELCNMLLDEGVIVSTSNREGHIEPNFATGDSIAEQKIVLLVNAGSASATEIAAAALRDNGRAKIVGQKTFGKGLIQSIVRLSDGSGVNLTTARYLSPLNKPITEGITPDFNAEISELDQRLGRGPWFARGGLGRSPTDGKDLQLVKAIDVLKSDLNQAPICVQYGNIEHKARRGLHGIGSHVVNLFSGLFRQMREFICDMA